MIEYRFRTLKDIADYFESLAERDSKASLTSTISRGKTLRITASTWRSAANTIRNTTLTGEANDELPNKEVR